MKNVKELGSTSTCYNMAGFDLSKLANTIPKTALIRQSAIRRAIQMGVKNPRKRADIEAVINDEFMSGEEFFPFKSNLEAEKKYSAEIARRVISAIIKIADGNPIKPGENYKATLGGEEYQVSVDYYIIKKDEVRAIAVESGKPVVKKAGRTDITASSTSPYIYGLIKAAENRGKEEGLETFNAIGQIVYMKAPEDNSSEIKDDFVFYQKSCPCAAVKVEKDKEIKGYTLYEEALARIKKGHSCNDATCEKCKLYNHCNFKHAPKSLELEENNNSLNSMTFSRDQQKVIGHAKGVMRVMAGAGAGKTTVTVVNVAELICGGCSPEKILFVSFTNASVEATKEKLAMVLADYGIEEEEAKKVKIVTFNGLGQEIIEENYEALGFSAKPVVATQIEIREIISDIVATGVEIEGENVQYPFLDIHNFKGIVPALEEYLMKVKETGVHENENGDFLEAVIYNLFPDFSDRKVWQISHTYRLFAKALKEKNLVTYSDQINMVFELLRENPNLFEDFGWSHIIVDEFQDSSADQLELVCNIINTTSYRSLMVVGDDMQSIYGFRDAKVENILELPSLLGKPVIDVSLIDNHRSTREIVDVGNEVATFVKTAFPKKMVSKVGPGAPVSVIGFDSKDEESSYIANQIAALVAKGTKKSDICYICRTRAEVTKMMSLLTERGVAAVCDTPVKVLDNSKVKAVVGLVQYLKEQVATISIYDFIDAIYEGEFEPSEKNIHMVMENKKTITDMWNISNDEEKRDMLFNIIDNLEDGDSVYHTFVRMLDRFRIGSISELMDYLTKLLLYNVSPETTIEGNFDAVTIITAHSSKGLEWKHVFLSISSFDKVNNPDKEDDVWRLIFVGATRARENLSITSVRKIAKGRGNYYFNNLSTRLRESLGIAC